MEPDRGTTIRRASWVGIVGNAALAAAKLVGGFVAHSFAVMSDGVDSGVDVLGSVVGLIAGRLVDKPPDAEHPYGHTRAETIATKAMSFIIFFAGAQVAVSAVEALVTGARRPVPGALALYVTVISVVGKSALAVYKFRQGNRIGSRLLIADAKNMRADIAISVAVLVGLLSTHLFEAPWVDPVIALGISAWILRVAFGLFLETSEELMDGSSDPDLYQRVFQAIAETKGADNPHRTRVRRIGGMVVVDLDIEVDGSLSVMTAHSIAQDAERRIKNLVPNAYDILVHVEPRGNVENSERYGLRSHGDSPGSGCGP
jgi:cation diffusion facilitator family transporter